MAANIPLDLVNLEPAEATLDIYATVRLSVNYGDSDLGDVEEQTGRGLSDGNFGLSSNTTLIGFRGGYVLKETPFTAIWQVEQNWNPDINAGDTLANRDSFIGLTTPVGVFRAGLISTPFKIAGLSSVKYVTTAGDPAAIMLGKSSISGARLGLRGSNSLHWNGSLGPVRLAAQYGFDQNTGTTPGRAELPEVAGTAGYQDDNNSDMFSMSAAYSIGDLGVRAAYINFSDLYGEDGVEAWNAGISYSLGDAKFGAYYEDVDGGDSVAGSLTRSAYNSYAAYKILPQTTLGVQWAHANESDFGDDSADQYSLGIEHSVRPNFLIHAIATTTVNDDNARFRSGDYAHGDKLETVSGGSPRIYSVGAQIKF